MALKRLDEEFELKPGTQLLPYMRRLLPSLEGRFQEIESDQDTVNKLAEEIRAAALLRMNEILIPATEDIIAVTKLGFLLAPSSTLMELKLGPTFLIVDEGPQRDSFTPSPYLIIEREANHDDYAIARLDGYTQATGELLMTITAWHGNAGPHSDWVVSSTPGMADSTKLYHDAVAPMHDTVVADHAEVVTLHAEIIQAAEDLAESGLDLTAYIRKDGTRAFTAVQPGVSPPVGSNDASLATTAWSRARIIEYAGNALMRTGGTMTGPLQLAGAPTIPLHAATKAYVDSIIFSGGVIGNSVTLQTVNPSLRLHSTGTGQLRQIEALAPQGSGRWALHIADSAPETGGDAGSNFSLVRYGDSGSIIDTALGVNRQTGITSVKGLNSAGNVNAVGDIALYRPGSPTTGALYMNQARTAYHYFDGSNHSFAGGGVSCAQLAAGHINCLSIYTQGYGITTWGMTSHGNVTVNGAQYINGGLSISSAGPIITFSDTDWGPMHVHAQGGNIGFLNHGGAWIQYTTINGHIWSPAYGWMHDYINQQASAYSWYAADYRYNQLVSSERWVHAGDIEVTYYGGQYAEIGNAAVTSLWMNSTRLHHIRFRQLQHMIAGQWYTSGWAS